jgi:hypothetical protein
MKIIIPKNTLAAKASVNYYFCVDTSGSMLYSIKDLKDTLHGIKDLLSPGDSFSLAYFSSYRDFDWICKGATSTTNLDQLINERVYARSLTCFTDVLGSLQGTVRDVELLTGNKTHALYFLTDGHPNDNSPESKILQYCRELSTVFQDKQVVGYSLYYNRSLLINMAETIGGTFSHVSDHVEASYSYQAFVETKKTYKVLDLPKAYDLLWQITPAGINVLIPEGNTVKIAESEYTGELCGVDYSELENLPEAELQNLSFVLSLAYVLSQKNKANLGVALLRKVGLYTTAKVLQKAFTVQQKGQAENFLQANASDAFDNKSTVVPEPTPQTVFIDDFLESVEGTTIRFDLSSKYKSITRGGGDDLSKVKFQTTSDNARITEINRNENRANISLQTVREGAIVEILDEDLKTRVEEFNRTAKTRIVLPIQSSTFRNYALVANGDFNFDTIVFENSDGSLRYVKPSSDIDLFDSEVKEVTLDRFAGLYKSLISEKAHLSVLNFYLKANADQRHEDDVRVQKYGTEGAALLEEMGLDYKMRYSPKREYKKKDETGDYIPFLEISGQLKGAATISASASYAKYVDGKKPNVGDEIVFPFFKQYDKLKEDLEKEDFIQALRDKIDSQEKTVERLQAKVSTIKFYLISTNSWFSDAEKADELLHEGVVIKTKTVNEYI